LNKFIYISAPVKKKNKLHKGEESIQMPILSCTAIVTALKNNVSQSNEISNEIHTGMDYPVL